MRSASVHGGFTLVEVVVVIGIIIVLVALTISVGVVVVEGSEVRQTETVLRQLDTALQEWQTHADRRVTWGDNSTGAVYDLQDGTPHVLTITELLGTIARPAQIKSIVAQIDPAFVHTYDTSNPAPRWIAQVDPDDPDPNAGDAQSVFDNGWPNTGEPLDGMLSILDAWDLPIRAVHPGRVRDPNLFPNDSTAILDPDGTIRIDDVLYYGVEDIYGVAKNRQILFVSAGPDGKFGDLQLEILDPANRDPELVQQVKDNIYSYQALTENPQ